MNKIEELKSIKNKLRLLYSIIKYDKREVSL